MMSEEKNNVLISMQLSKDLHTQLKQKAKENGLNVSSFIRFLVIKALAEEKSK